MTPDESRWQPSRLIPVSGIRGEAEQERRGCSALLAVIESVREFGRALLVPLGAPAGAVSTFVEVWGRRRRLAPPRSLSQASIVR